MGVLQLVRDHKDDFPVDRIGIAKPTILNAATTCRGMQRLLNTLEELRRVPDGSKYSGEVREKAAKLLQQGIHIPSTTRLEGK